MTDQNSSGPNPNNDLRDEIHNLGKNLEEILQTLWASEERQRIQRELSDGLTEVSINLRKAADEFSQSDTGKMIRSDVEAVHRSVESGEFQDKARSEFMSVLKQINHELEQASESIKKQSDPGSTGDTGNPPGA
jgi:ElaB/YqjD/DUF883 family membrane-anchored ribosome-binding protein